MEESGCERSISAQEVLDTFDHRNDSSEPLTTAELADTLGCSRRTVREMLFILVEKGELATKRMDDKARVWWRTNATVATRTTTVLRQCSEASSMIPNETAVIVKSIVDHLLRFLRVRLLDPFSSRIQNETAHNPNEEIHGIDPNDPFWRSSGMLPTDGPSDISANTDAYLYQRSDTLDE